MDIADLVIDTETAAAGVWAEYREGAAFLLTSTNTAEFAAAQEAIYTPIIEAKSKGREQAWVDKAFADAEIELYAKHVLRDWRGLEDGGKPVPFSVETAIKLLSQPGAFHLMRFIRNSAARLDLYRAKRVDDLGKP
jgi:hypothetical protein